MASPLLSILIVSWNVRDLLRDCIRSVYAHTKLSPELWELIVVENNSADGSSKMIAEEFPDVILLRSRENLGFAGGNNLGFRICRGNWILLLNPDTILLDDAIDRMLQEIALRDKAAVLGCNLRNADGSFQRWTGGRVPNLPNVICHFLLLYKVLPPFLLPAPLYLEREPAETIRVGWVSGACMMLRRSALGNSLFDERFFMYCEDVDLCRRLSADNWEIWFSPHIRIIHLEGKSLAGQNPAVQLEKVRNMRRFFAMQNGRISLLVYDCVVILGFAFRTVINAIAAVLIPGKGFDQRTIRSGEYTWEAFKCLSTKGSRGR
jgi:GT2 family glycosyltransferase